MSNRGLIIALVASATLNVFAAAAGTALLISRDKVEDRVELQSRAPRSNSPMQLVQQLDAGVQQRVREQLRAGALTARPDFEEARAARREAVALAQAATYDPKQVQALLERSRAAEMRGRARLEATSLQVLSTLEPADRQVLAQILSRRNHAKDKAGERPAEPAR